MNSTANMAEDGVGFFDRKREPFLCCKRQPVSSSIKPTKKSTRHRGLRSIRSIKFKSKCPRAPLARRDRAKGIRELPSSFCPLFTTTETFRNLKCSNIKASRKKGKVGQEQGIFQTGQYKTRTADFGPGLRTGYKTRTRY